MLVEYAMQHAWLVPLLPALAFVVIVFLTRPWQKLSAIVAVGSMALSCVIATLAAYGIFTNHEYAEKPLVYATRWFSLGLPGMPNLQIDVGVQLDPVSAMMMVMVSFISTFIFLYSIGYMDGEDGFSVFFLTCHCSVPPCFCWLFPAICCKCLSPGSWWDYVHIC